MTRQADGKRTATGGAGSSLLTLALAAVFVAGLPAIAEAHITQDSAGGFVHGFLHPLSGADHLLAMFSVGLWGAQMGGRSVWSLPITFPLIMVIGGVLGIAGVPIPGVEIGIALSILVLGAAIAFSWKPQEWVALAIISVFAICHGYAHGAELPIASDPADYAIGFVVATGMIHILGILVGLYAGRLYNGKLARILGAMIAPGGVYFLMS
jgi:urease accessory protein